MSWSVMLGGQFVPYEDAAQRTIEAAFLRGDRSVEVCVRGTEYILQLAEPFKQVVKSDSSRARAVQIVASSTTAAEDKRKRGDDTDTDEADPSADPVSDPVHLLDGLSYSCTFHNTDSSKQYYGSDISIKFKCICSNAALSNAALGCNLESFYDWRSTKGYLVIGHVDKSKPPLLTLKISESIKHRGGYSFSGSMADHTYGTSFTTTPGASLDTSSTLLIKLDEEGLAAAEKVRLTALQHRPAFLALLDACGAAFDVTVHHTCASNKATYIELTAESPCGTLFELDVRVGGVFMSESRVVKKLKENVVRSLREFAALGDGLGTYGRVTLSAAGSELDIGPDGFTIDKAVVTRTTGGKFTVAPSASR